MSLLKPRLARRLLRCPRRAGTVAATSLMAFWLALPLSGALAAVAPVGRPDFNGASVPGQPKASALVTRIHSTDPGELMPPPEQPRKLDSAQKLLEPYSSAVAVYGAACPFAAYRLGVYD